MMGFHGAAPAFSAVIREATRGAPLALFRKELQNQVVVLNLAQWMPAGQSIVMDLFGDHADATTYFGQCGTGWTPEELVIINDPATLHMIPDVAYDPQNRIRAARHACDPSNPASVAQMNAQLLVNYQRFSSRFDGRVLPEVARPGIKGIWIAAPGNPPEWIPPD